MTKSVKTIDKFKLGIHAAQDPRDLEEGALADAINVMTDVEGVVRQMGIEVDHPISGALLTTGGRVPGQGFFAFRTDNRIKDNINQIGGIDTIFKESVILCYQAGKSIGFYDVQSNDDVIQVGPIENNVVTSFYYSVVDGALRVCDSNYDNMTLNYNSITGEPESIDFQDSNVFTRYFKFMNKTWFTGPLVDSDSGNAAILYSVDNS